MGADACAYAYVLISGYCVGNITSDLWVKILKRLNINISDFIKLYEERLCTLLINKYKVTPVSKHVLFFN